MKLRHVVVVALCQAPPAFSAPPIVAVDVVDVLPVAAAVIAGSGDQGPCGRRAGVAVLRTDVDRFMADPASVPTTPRPLPAARVVEVGGHTLPLLPGPGLFAGEGEVFAAAVDAALLKAKVTATAPTSFVWRNGLPALQIAASADAPVIEAALRAFVPTSAWLTATEAAVAKARVLARRTPGVSALETVDARLCLGAGTAATTSTLSPAVVRAALAAPLPPT